MSDSSLSKEAIVIERTFDAPADIVWQLWTQPEYFKRWYGPQGFAVPVAQMDVRIGGKHLFCMEMKTPEGSRKMWSTGEYMEVVPNKRLVYTESMADEHGNVLLASAVGMGDDYPMITEVTVLLEEHNGVTKMVMTHAGLPANGQGANDGWEQAFAKMADLIKTLRKNQQ